MIVISDTAPLNYLVLIGQQELLARLFGRVIIPRAVWTELQAQGTPESVKVWLAGRPDWLEVRQANLSADAALTLLDDGEQEAILLAQELGADLLLMDDKDGRLEAERRNLAVVGTLGILDRAAQRDLLDLPDAVGRLQRPAFALRQRCSNHFWKETPSESGFACLNRMNKNHLLTDDFSNENSQRLYLERWPNEPDIAERVKEGEQCGGCSFYAPFNADYGLCCHPESRHHLETVFEHFGCDVYEAEGWGAHSFRKLQEK